MLLVGAFGVVLMQDRRPISFYNIALADRSLSKSAYEKEIMALALSIQHWCPYLLGRPFTVHTDQKSLKHLLDQRITTTDQQNWLSKLIGYRCSICYKRSICYKQNRAADALSRVHEGAELSQMLSYPQWLDGDTLCDGYDSDPQLQKIIQSLTSQPSSYPHFRLTNGRLYRKHKLVLSSSSQWILNCYMNTTTALIGAIPDFFALTKG